MKLKTEYYLLGGLVVLVAYSFIKKDSVAGIGAIDKFLSKAEIKEKAAKIIKDLGVSKKDISLIVSSTAYSTEISVRAKNSEANGLLNSIVDALSVLERVDRCPSSGEILGGCNVFVSKISYRASFR